MCGIVLGWSQDFNQVELFEDKLGGSNTIGDGIVSRIGGLLQI